MTSKYFVPRKDDGKFEWLEGIFYCEECDEVMGRAKHMLAPNVYTWQCPNRHITTATPQDLGIQ